MAKIDIPGLHRVKAPLARGRVGLYLYRWRGGPLLASFQGDTLAQAEALEAAWVATLVDGKPADDAPPPAPATLLVRHLITAYRADKAEGLLSLAPATQAKWTRWLDRINDAFGDLPARALKARGMVKEIRAWRDQWIDTPRTADFAIQVIRRLFNHALANEDIERNPAAGIASVWSASRAAKIVEEHQLGAILPQLKPRLRRAIALAAATGLRRGDLVDLRVEDLDDFSIELGTNKSGEQTRVIIPLLPEARAVIAEILEEREALKAAGRIPSAFLLTSSAGKPWAPDTITHAFTQACADAKVQDRTLHDLRGTAATRYMLAGFSDEQIGELMGWETDDVRAIRRKYVDRQNIAKGVIRQLEKAERNR